MTTPHPHTSDPATSADQRITHAAIALITEHGLGGVSMSALAKTAGVSRQTLYNHYPDVESIVAAAITEHNKEALTQLDTSLSLCATPGDKITHFIRHFAALGAHSHTHQLEHGLSAVAQGQLADYDNAIDERIQAAIEQGIKTGAFRRDLNATTDTTLIHSLLRGVQQAAARTPTDAAAIVQSGTRTVLAAITQY
jgi:AcrR family transcriptional regulator